MTLSMESSAIVCVQDLTPNEPSSGLIAISRQRGSDVPGDVRKIPARSQRLTEAGLWPTSQPNTLYP